MTKRNDLGKSAFFMSTPELKRTLAKNRLNQVQEDETNPPNSFQESKESDEDFQTVSKKAFLQVQNNEN